MSSGYLKNNAPFVLICPLFVLILLIGLCTKTKAGSFTEKDTVIIKPGIQNKKISRDWKNALASRMSRERIDSMAGLSRTLTPEEEAWQNLISSKTQKWNAFKDSLAIPFAGVKASDTIFVLLGYRGSDDGFTYGFQTVCLDLTALHSAYGKAGLAENDNRIDRIYAHEYTHLLHKIWAGNNRLNLPAFRDSILWECLYEGIGMYRSLNPGWMPIKGELPALSKTAMEKLCTIFVDRLVNIEMADTLSAIQKVELHKNLSRGNVSQKWGAFPVAIWLALESGGDDSKLQAWINKGPAGVILLAKKYLSVDLQQKFSTAFP